MRHVKKIFFLKTTIARIFLVCFLFLNTFSYAQETSSVVKKSTKTTVINGKKYFLHTVQQGESLYAISRTYQVKISDIIAVNPDAANGIKPQDVLKIPVLKNENRSIINSSDSLKYDYHKVVHGETLYSLSRKAGISVSEFTDLNPASKNGLKVDEIVRTPKNKTDEKMSETEIKNANSAVKKFESVSTKINAETVKTDTISNKKDSIISVDSIVKKGIYNIALFLPLNLENIDSVNVDAIARGNGTFPPRTKIALSFYEGAVMAIDSMKKEGLKCRVFVYSYSLNGNDSVNNVIKKIFQKPEFLSMNLIIGPLYSSTFNLAEKLAKKKNIPIISPFIKQNKILFGYPDVFKAAPSDYTQIDTLANYVAAKYPNQNIVVIKNDNSENNTNAELFKNKFLKTSKNAAHLNEATFISKDFGGVQKDLSSSKKTIVVMLSENQSYVTNFINSLENASENDSVVLIGLEAIHGFDNLDLSYLNNLELHFPSNVFVDYTDNNTQKFIGDYRNTYLTEPDRYVYQGFDVTYYCLNVLKNYGVGFMQSLPEMKMKGIQTSFDFYKTSVESGFENRAVYILEYKNLELVKATK